jgi:hypothetical protein
LPEGVSEQVASVVFHNSARNVVKDGIKHARFQSIAYYHRNVLKQPMNARQAKALNFEGPKEVTRGGRGVNGSQSNIPAGTWPIF